MTLFVAIAFGLLSAFLLTLLIACERENVRLNILVSRLRQDRHR